MRRPNRKWPLWGLSILALFTGWLAYNNGTYTKVLTEDELQQRINAVISQRLEEGIKTVNVQNAQVSLTNNQIHIETDIVIDVMRRLAKVHISAVGEPDYHNGDFYFNPTGPITLTHIKMVSERNPARYHEMPELIQIWINDHTEPMLFTIFSRYPVYRVHEDVKGIVIRTALDKISITNNSLLITISVIKIGFLLILTGILSIGVIAVLLMMVFITADMD